MAIKKTAAKKTGTKAAGTRAPAAEPATEAKPECPAPLRKVRARMEALTRP